MADGEQFLAVTDKGNWLRGRIVYRTAGRSRSPTPRWRRCSAPTAGRSTARGWYDAEALAEDGGIVYVGIERVNQIVRFDYGKDGLRARGQPIAVPPAIKSLPHNQGVECLRVGPAGRAARRHADRDCRARPRRRRQSSWAFSSAAPAGAFALKRTDDFDVSDCALTPRGELLVLERRFSWLRGLAMRIRSVPLARCEAWRAGRRAGPDRRRPRPADRQHGRPVGASRSRTARWC